MSESTPTPPVPLARSFCTGLIFFTGLGMQPTWNGLGYIAPQLKRVADAAGIKSIEIFSYADPLASNVIIRRMLPDINYGTRRGKPAYDFLAAIGFSHGAECLAKNLAAFAALPSRPFMPVSHVGMAAIIDECPVGDPLAPNEASRTPSLAVDYGVAVWQRHGVPQGRSYVKADNWICEDTSLWTTPELSHIDDALTGRRSIAADSRVWNLIQMQLMQAVAQRMASFNANA